MIVYKRNEAFVMNFKSFTALFVILTILIQTTAGVSVFAVGEEAQAVVTSAGTEYVSIGTTNEAGDYCYFNNHYCYTSTNPNYNNFNAVPKTNYIECYRLDYTNPKRKDYIYLEKTDADTDCYFDISCNRLSYVKYAKRYYDYFLIQGDLKVGVPGANVQMFLLRDKSTGTNVDHVSAILRGDGSIKLSNGTVIEGVGKVNTWFNYKVAINLVTRKYDIYINDICVGSDNIKDTFTTLNMVRMNLLTGTGSMYADNFSVTGLEKPFENGVEVKSDVFPDNPEIEEFMQGKVGLHGYGKLMYKDGVKTVINPEPVYDADAQELYVSADTLNEIFGLNLTETAAGLSGDNVSVASDGSVTYKGKAYSLSNGTLAVTDRLYVPVVEFARIVGKYSFSYQNGIIVISDVDEFIDTTAWQYVTFRPDQSAITLFNDVDFLNNFLSYEQPDSERLNKDFATLHEGETYETAHPRILLNQSGFDRLKYLYETDETYKFIANKVISKANGYANKPPLVYEFDDAMRMYRSGAETQNRFMFWGYAYKLTGDEKYVKRAVAELEALDKFPDFNPMHIIDTGMFCMGLACAYDWFYDAYTPEERELAKRVVFEKCFKSLSDAYYGRLSQATSGNGAIKWTSNYNAVVSGGCLNAAIATIECDPEYNLDMIDNCVRSLEYTLAGIMPGGGWSESVSYWNYTMEFLSYSMASLNTTFGSDYGIKNSQGMEETLKYAMACLGVGGMYNYHDSGQGVATKTYSYKTFMYLANAYDIRDAYGMRMYDLLNSRTSPVVEDGLFYNENLTEFDDVYDKEGTEIKIDGTELFSARDTYDFSKSQFYFGTHFGATWGYHHHADCGNFVLDMFGTRFADDLGADDYNIENELKYSSFELYRKRAEGHNVMVFEPKNHSGGFEQILNVFAPVINCDYNGTKSYVVADMDAVYNEADRMKQGYYIDENKMSVTMRNEFTTTPGTEVYWFMHTRADIEIDGNVAYLTRDGHTICVRFDTNAPVAEIMKMKAEPLPTSPQVPEQNPNEVYSKVAIRMEAGAANYLTVNICPMENAGDKILSEPLATWSLGMDEEAKIQTVASYDSYADFGTVQSGSEAKGVYGRVKDDSSLKVAAGNSTVRASYNEIQPEHRYTVASFNIAPFRTAPAISDSRGNNLLGDVQLNSEVWNSICAIYDNEQSKVLMAVNGSYGNWTNTSYRGDVAELALMGNNSGSYAYIDDFELYSTTRIPDIGYVTMGGATVDGSYILSDGTLTPNDLTTNGVVRVYTDSTMTQQLSATEPMTEGNVAVFVKGNLYTYFTVTLQEAVEIPTKYNQYIDSFDGLVPVRASVTEMPDPTGIYGTSGYLVGSDESDTNYYLNMVVPVDDTVKTMSVDVYPSDSVTGIKFATNGHVPLSKVVKTTALNANQWNNLTLVADPVTDTNTLYINDVESGTVTYELANNLRVVFHTDKTSLSDVKIYVDNIVMMGGTVPTEVISTDYAVSGNTIDITSGITVSEFKEKFRTVSYKYSYKIHGSEGVLYNSDTIDEGDVLYMYAGDMLIGRYTLK